MQNDMKQTGAMHSALCRFPSDLLSVGKKGIGPSFPLGKELNTRQWQMGINEVDKNMGEGMKAVLSILKMPMNRLLSLLSFFAAGGVETLYE